MVQIRHAGECDCKTCEGGSVPIPGQYGGWTCACLCHRKIPTIEQVQKHIKDNELHLRDDDKLQQLEAEVTQLRINRTNNMQELASLRTQLSKAKAEGVLMREAIKEFMQRPQRHDMSSPYSDGYVKVDNYEEFRSALSSSPLIEKEVRIREAKERVCKSARQFYFSGASAFNLREDLEALDQLTHEKDTNHKKD